MAHISITDRASLPHVAEKIIVHENSVRFISSTVVNRTMKPGISRMSGIFARCRLVGMKSTMLLRKALLRNGGKFAKFIRAQPGKRGVQSSATTHDDGRRSHLHGDGGHGIIQFSAMQSQRAHGRMAWAGSTVVRFSPACSFACPRLCLRPLAQHTAFTDANS